MGGGGACAIAASENRRGGGEGVRVGGARPAVGGWKDPQHGLSSKTCPGQMGGEDGSRAIGLKYLFTICHNPLIAIAWG